MIGDVMALVLGLFAVVWLTFDLRRRPDRNRGIRWLGIAAGVVVMATAVVQLAA